MVCRPRPAASKNVTVYRPSTDAPRYAADELESIDGTSHCTTNGCWAWMLCATQSLPARYAGSTTPPGVVHSGRSPQSRIDASVKRSTTRRMSQLGSPQPTISIASTDAMDWITARGSHHCRSSGGRFRSPDGIPARPRRPTVPSRVPCARFASTPCRGSPPARSCRVGRRTYAAILMLGWPSRSSQTRTARRQDRWAGVMRRARDEVHARRDAAAAAEAAGEAGRRDPATVEAPRAVGSTATGWRSVGSSALNLLTTWRFGGSNPRPSACKADALPLS